MSTATTHQFSKSLDPAINKVIMKTYGTSQTYYDKVAKIETAPAGNKYTEAQLSGLGALQTIGEGQPVSFDTPVEGNEKQRLYTKYGLGFQITEEMYKDDLHKNFMKMPAELGRSAAIKRETIFWDLFNSGFATHTAWDGNYIFVYNATIASTHHTLKTNEDMSNRPSTDASLSETSLQEALEYCQTAKDSAGRPSPLTPQTLIIPIQLQWIAKNLKMAQFKPGSMDNDINTVQDEGWSYMVNPFLTSASAWFLLTKEHDFRMYWKMPFTTRSWDDAPTGNACWAGKLRFSAFCNDPTGCWGTTGA